jgi:Rieske Fe-S protein
MNDKLFWRQSGPTFRRKNGEVVEKQKVLMHLCHHEGCTDWGSHSIGTRWKDGVPGRWYCAAHIGLYASSTSSPHTAPVIETEAKEDDDNRHAPGDLLDGA